MIGVALAALFVAWKFGSPLLPKEYRDLSFAKIIGRAAGEIDAEATGASADANAIAAGKKAKAEQEERARVERLIAAQQAALEMTKACRQGIMSAAYQARIDCTTREPNPSICDTRYEITESELPEKCPPIDPNTLLSTEEVAPHVE